MPKKRQTVDIAAIRRQAEDAGRALGRQDLAVELAACHRWVDTNVMRRADNCISFIDGVLFDPHPRGRDSNWRMREVAAALKVLEELLHKITEEANVPPFSD